MIHLTRFWKNSGNGWNLYIRHGGSSSFWSGSGYCNSYGNGFGRGFESHIEKGNGKSFTFDEAVFVPMDNGE